ncbi:very short patch repair endonuclease [Erwinia sp. OLTSP20]|uniref:very short patch repair endonuclease n=1 Tax=unclassified Erwinia TaxID=2622719 RepID=UPI000C18470E|nr:MULTISPECIES: DNA mismatch endonuclease Vsr [unclassified Erwinia]PIJ48527.1 very short patch repair endonuclease [Erwinia sp. OAMSP11]PIJ69153.1 very short patch repair endonuclease [Erwinia sp. OLSSP12]PIJ78792.1 very short patch repair endonuclease [Erwinia sp. OLCASP19]PIJ81832.1 very short patch repair endonuclease [Erwinia sp. OLMTSP26]PIJ82110.1 very short patch repair endonuclease [Erwinia sp. OLMDSP33]
MADVHSAEIRSKNMRAIGNRDTAIERRVAGLLTDLGLTFDVQDATLPGRPDFVLAEYNAVIFTHGCFWHKHHCPLFKLPATRREFWLKKIDANVARDLRDGQALNACGWRVLVIWECALRGRQKLSDRALTARLEEWLCAADGNSEIDPAGIHLSAAPTA